MRDLLGGAKRKLPPPRANGLPGLGQSPMWVVRWQCSESENRLTWAFCFGFDVEYTTEVPGHRPPPPPCHRGGGGVERF